MADSYFNPPLFRDSPEIYEPVDSKNSKAYASAMRALQDRIRELEAENSSLKHRLGSFEDKVSVDREK